MTPAPELAPACPVSASSRIDSLDVLRGVALLGILMMNVQSFATVDEAYANPTLLGEFSGANYAVWFIRHLAFEQKFLSIFSMLFGAGIVLMAERRDATGASPTRLHYRRMAVLCVIGLIHAYGIWHGDILVTYAVCGCAAYLFRRCRPAIQLAWGTAAYLLPVFIVLLVQASMAFFPVSSLEEWSPQWQPSSEGIAEQLAAMRGTWREQLPHRAESALYLQTLVLVFGTFWSCGGLMLIGMALYRWGVFSAARSPMFYSALIALGLCVGFPIVLLGMKLNEATAWSVAYSLFLGTLPNYLAAPLISLAWVGLVMLLCRAAWSNVLTRPLAAVGRMALTNYILQSVICTAIFYGHGLGWFGYVEAVGQLVVVVGIWVLQLCTSPLWLRFFQFGPLEWLWRSATYGSWQPLRRTAPAGLDVLNV